MEKIKVDRNAFMYPMPVVLVGTMIENRPNFMTVAWISRVNFQPPLVAVAIGLRQYTNGGIQTHQTFSVNIPSVDLIEKVDFCGLVSGRNRDKSKVFEIFNGELPNTPMVKDCPLTMECKVIQTVNLPADYLYIGEIVNAYCEDRYLTDGKPDIHKMKPFTLTMPDNQYWKIGEKAGKAWSIGKNYKAEGA
jgi:flavin reductase (DIM6/NTAB) family NADH-FMN oxidoreductase RutF